MDKLKDMASKAAGKGGSSEGVSSGGGNAINDTVHKGALATRRCTTT